MSHKCSICLEEISDTDNIITKCCKQIFHTHCYNKWLKINSNCPLCRSVEFINTIFIKYIELLKNNHYEVKSFFNNNTFLENNISYLYNQVPQAWLDFSKNNSLTPIYILNKKNGGKTFITFYLRQLILRENVDISKIIYKYDDDSKLYLSSNQKFNSCTMSRDIMNILTNWLYELLMELKNIYNFTYLKSLNSLILDLTIGYIVKNNLKDCNKYQQILIISVYNVIKFYHINDIININNYLNEINFDELKKKLIWFTDNSCGWDNNIDNTISQMISNNIILK